ncbi:MAG: hypothetical protein ACO26U_05210 [Burkholderiaceae bacterium]
MSSVNAPFGLRDAYHPSGTLRPVAGTILSTYNTDIYTGSPVKMGTNGTIELAAAGERLIGLFAGCEYTPGNGRRVVSPYWPANTVATDIVAYYTMDPYIVYEIQADGTIDLNEIGQQADFTNAGSGSSVTGLSTATISASTSSSGSAQLRIIGIANGINNAAGDAYTVVQVQISEHQYVATQNAF